MSRALSAAYPRVPPGTAATDVDWRCPVCDRKNVARWGARPGGTSVCLECSPSSWTSGMHPDAGFRWGDLLATDPQVLAAARAAYRSGGTAAASSYATGVLRDRAGLSWEP